MNLENKVDKAYIVANKDQFKKIFFYRISGTGMGAAACLLKEKGIHVEGADSAFHPPMGDYLKSTGIPCHQIKEITPDFLKNFDLIVVGNVVGRMSDDARMIESLGIPFCSFPAAIGGFVLNDVNVIGIAGTHGKTTTTYLMMQLFENLGFNPGYFIGGVIDGRMSSQIGDGKHFFIESDEYDSAYFEKFSKFHSYSIDHLVLTSLEFDHADIYENLEQIKNEFRRLIPTVKGFNYFSSDYKASKDLFNEFNLKGTLYGDSSSVGPKIMSENEQGTSFELTLKNKKELFKTNLVGGHNILNLATCLFYATDAGIDVEKSKTAILNLKLVKRRQEVRGLYKGAVVIDDFAHHPTAVAVTLDALKKRFPGKKIITVIEPSSATARSSAYENEYPSSLKLSNVVIWANAMRPTTAKNMHDLNFDLMNQQVNDLGIKSLVVCDLVSLQKTIENEISPDSLLAILTNGTCLGLWQSDFVNAIKK